MKLGMISTPSLPEAKPKLEMLAKFMLLASGFIIGRRLHFEVEKFTGGHDIIRFKGLMGGEYALTYSDTAYLALSLVLYFVLNKYGKFFRWFGAGMVLYIFTWELYELIFGRTFGDFPVPLEGYVTPTATATVSSIGV